MKKIIFLLLFMLSSVYLFASEISSIGYGKTESEAMKNAKLELAKKIFSTFIVSETHTSVSQSDSNSSEKFNQESNSLQFGTLAQIKYENIILNNSEKNTLGSFGIRAYITDDSATLNFYKQYLEDAKLNAIDCYKRITNINNNHDINSLKSLISYYPELLNYTIQYNSYAQILYALGHNELVPTLDLIPNKTYNILSNEYYSVLIEYDNLLRNNTFSSNLTESLVEVLNENSKRIQELREQKENAFTLEQAQREALLTAKIKALSESIEYQNFTNADDFNSDYNKLMDDIKNFNEVASNYFSLIESEKERINKDLEEEILTIRNRPYRLGQLDKYGNPLNQYKEERETEITNLNKEREAEKESVISFIDSNMKSIILTSYNEIINDLNNINSIIYTASSFNEKLNVILLSQGAVENDYIWTFKIYPNFLNAQIPEGQLDIRLSDLIILNNLTNEEKLDSIDYYNELLSYEFQKYFNLEVKFSVNFNSLNNITISYKEVKLTARINKQNGNEIKRNYRTYDFNIYTPYINIADTSSISWMKTDSRISNTPVSKTNNITVTENKYSNPSEPAQTDFSPTNPSTSSTSNDPLEYQNKTISFEFFASLSSSISAERNNYNGDVLFELGAKMSSKYINLGGFLILGGSNNKSNKPEPEDFLFSFGGGVRLEVPFGVSRSSLFRTTDMIGIIDIGGYINFTDSNKSNNSSLFIKILAGVSYRNGYTAFGLDFRPLADKKIYLTISTSYSFSNLFR